jgi:hypothetical protein
MIHSYPLPQDESIGALTPTERERQRREFIAAFYSAQRDLNPPASTQHLAVVAFLAAMARVAGLTIASADAIYVAGYAAKKEQQGRELYPYERTQLRRAADRVWSALQQVQANVAGAQ